MKIKIVEAGWAGFTGHLGAVEFVDGVSVEDVSRADAAQLSALVAVEDVATGANPSDAQRIVDSRAFEAKVETRLTSAEQPAPQAPAVIHTKESLEAIADERGIKGVREIAEPLGLKGNSIAELIEKVLKKQAEAVAAAAVTA